LILVEQCGKMMLEIEVIYPQIFKNINTTYIKKIIQPLKGD
jgi:hypothetical protein